MLPMKYIPCACKFNKASFFNKNVELIQKKFSTKYKVELMEDIKNRLDSGELKHRKHPGVRKMPPIKLPSYIQEGIYRLVANENESDILKDSREMCKHLLSRRLPVEMEEIQDKINKTSSELNENKEDMSEMMKKIKILQLQGQIKTKLGQWKPLDFNQYECLIYLAGRASPNYASTYRVFTEIQNINPMFQPKTIFDFGSGVGSSIWAANSIWGDSIKEYFSVDSSAEMNDLSQSLLTVENTEEMFIKNVNYRQFLPASDTIKYDLVVSAFSLIDLPSAKDRLQVIDILWRKTNNFLVIIEYGNLAGFYATLDARDYILHIENSCDDQMKRYATGAHVICPCPHDSPCPMLKVSPDPCGLAVSYQTIFPRNRNQLKKDWISYVVLKKGPRPQDYESWPRLVKPVLKKHKHAHCTLCCNDGQLHHVIMTKIKQGRHEYRSAKSSSLGDLLPINISKLPNEANVIKESYCENDEKQNKT